MSAYSEKLKDPRWQKKRLEILERDGWKCMGCGSKDETLHVHHLFYQPHKEPWDIHNAFLITFCEWCHLQKCEAGPCEKCEHYNKDCFGTAKPGDDIVGAIASLLEVIREDNCGHFGGNDFYNKILNAYFMLK